MTNKCVVCGVRGKPRDCLSFHRVCPVMGESVSQISCYSGYNVLDVHLEGEGLLDAHFSQEREEEEHKKLIEAKKHKLVHSVSDHFLVPEVLVDVVEANEETDSVVEPPAPPVDLTPYLPTKEDSNDPSYSRLVLPYTAVCRQRLRRTQLKMEAQFIKEIRQHERFQSKALDGVRIHREFCKSIIKVPKFEEIIKLTQKQKEKLGIIMGREY